MKRKLIKQGGAGFTIYLPKKWIDERGLKAGDEVDVAEIEGNIMISASSIPTKKEIYFELRPNDSFSAVRVMINNIYKLGYDIVRVKYHDKKQEEAIRSIVEEQTLGFEITENQNNRIIIESVAEPSEEKQEVILRRAFLLIKSSFEIAEANIKNSEFKDLEPIKKNLFKVDQYLNFCKRNISKRRFSNDKISFYWMVYSHLRNVQHTLFHMCRRAIVLFNEKESGVKSGIKSGVKLCEETKEMISLIKGWFEEIYSAFFKNDTDSLINLNRRIMDYVYKIFPEALSKTKGIDSHLLYYITQTGRFMYLMINPMIGLIQK